MRSTVAESIPLGDDARIYGHQVCLSADIGRVLLIDGGDVAPAETKIKLRPFTLQTHSDSYCVAWSLPKHEIRRVNLLPALALLDDATVSNHGALLKLWFGIGHVLQEEHTNILPGKFKHIWYSQARHKGWNTMRRWWTHVRKHLEDLSGDGQDAAGVHLIPQLGSWGCVPLGGEQEGWGIAAARQRHPWRRQSRAQRLAHSDTTDRRPHPKIGSLLCWNWFYLIVWKPNHPNVCKYRNIIIKYFLTVLLH